MTLALVMLAAAALAASLRTPVPKYGDRSPERGARIARRDDREHREYLREEPRREAGCRARNTLAYLGSGVLKAGRRAWQVAIAIAVVAAVELCPAPLRFRDAPAPVAAYRMLATLPFGAVAEFPFFYRPANLHLHSFYVVNSAWHWQPLLNGYSDHFPAGYRETAFALSQFPSPESFAILRRHRVRYVVVHPRFYDHQRLAAVRERLLDYAENLRPLVVDADAWLYEDRAIASRAMKTYFSGNSVTRM